MLFVLVLLEGVIELACLWAQTKFVCAYIGDHILY